MSSTSVSLRLSVTDRCDLRCVYCRPAGVDSPRSVRANLTTKELTRFVLGINRALGVAKVRITGGEPLLREDIVDVVRGLAVTGAPDLALTTNGQRLGLLASELRRAGLQRLNVSLDTLDADAFRTLSRTGTLQRTIAGIDAALSAGFSSVKINTVVMRGLNDQQTRDLVDFGLDRGCEVRFIELMAAGLDGARYDAWYVPTAELLGQLARWFTLEPLPSESGASAQRYRVVDHAGRLGVVGFISPNSRPFCSGCRRLRLTAAGDLVACLGRGDRVPLAGLLKVGDAPSIDRVVEAARHALRRKRTELRLRVPALMSATGG